MKVALRHFDVPVPGNMLGCLDAVLQTNQRNSRVVQLIASIPKWAMPYLLQVIVLLGFMPMEDNGLEPMTFWV